MSGKVNVIAYYLPQYHPIKENDSWWGKGFTEWTNVGLAKRLYPGHYQPRVPADLGYYDLRIPEVRKQQAELAKEAGVDAFCYWHYWYKGKQLLEMPLQEVVRLGEPDFPFCLAWANHSWEKKDWNPKTNVLSKELLIAQEYGDVDEIKQHFNEMLPAFKDKRYYKISGRLVFGFFKVADIPEDYFAKFVETWDALAKECGLPGFCWIAYIDRPEQSQHSNAKRCDALNYVVPLIGPQESRMGRIVKKALSVLLHLPTLLVPFEKLMARYDFEFAQRDNVFPTILSGFDHSPRRGRGGIIITKFNPKTFFRYAVKTINCVMHKSEDLRVVFVKSWNEWGEGNYMEPDQRYGKQYINALRKALKED